MNYNTHGDNHEGARQFVFWHLSQLQYKNPNIQVATFKNLTPTPFIRCYLGQLKLQLYYYIIIHLIPHSIYFKLVAIENGEEVLMDVDFKSKEEIFDRVRKMICKSE